MKTHDRWKYMTKSEWNAYMIIQTCLGIRNIHNGIRVMKKIHEDGGKCLMIQIYDKGCGK